MDYRNDCRTSVWRMHVGHLLASYRQTIYKVLLHTTCVTFCVPGGWSNSVTVRVLESLKQENFGTNLRGIANSEHPIKLI